MPFVEKRVALFLSGGIFKTASLFANAGSSLDCGITLDGGGANSTYNIKKKLNIPKIYDKEFCSFLELI